MYFKRNPSFLSHGSLGNNVCIQDPIFSSEFYMEVSLGKSIEKLQYFRPILSHHFNTKAIRVPNYMFVSRLAK
jgi:hypothetical protein